MKRTLLLSLGLIIGLGTAGPAAAACFADYKAKKDKPLRLHYGVIELPAAACDSRKTAAAEITKRIRGDGWKLLNVMSTFGNDGLAERKESAGAFYLRY
ncbi:hypothetical protein [Actibacterium ureilyticum]|uniref:hypothetical protein n=1 Tax=Actibacterium ureilyticum TaxID=1590614 RepID=UPI000BAAC7AE|nr:hypothetical protein [Actibacterium ureilyticum]